MCGIYALFSPQAGQFKPNGEQFKFLEYRGPDTTRIIQDDEFYLRFQRLAVVGLADGMQPMFSNGVYLLCNGEIYNYKNLALQNNVELQTDSDCEIILSLYNMFVINYVINKIEGEFAFILFDTKKNYTYFARDPLGIKPLYFHVGIGASANLEICSLLDCMNSKEQANHVIPRRLYEYDIKNNHLAYRTYTEFEHLPINPSYGEIYDYNRIIKSLYNAIRVRITQSERPVGFLLSGGLDSSIVVSLAFEIMKENGSLEKSKPQLFTFGFHHDAPDVISAHKMINWLRQKYGMNSFDWHLVLQPISEGLAVRPDVIHTLETYDTTTIRASVPMYLVSKYIHEKTNVIVLLSGEGSDELFGGYLYSMYAKTDEEFRADIIERLEELYLYDALRADRTTARWSLEVRPPFLDIKLIHTVLSSPYLKKNTHNTKELLRLSIEHNQIFYNLLPRDILHGKKEAFSDAVGLEWKDSIEKASGEFFLRHKDEFFNTSKNIEPKTHEMIFNQYYFHHKFHFNYDVLKHLWLPKWCVVGVEPSARVLDVYKKLDNNERKK